MTLSKFFLCALFVFNVQLQAADQDYFELLPEELIGIILFYVASPHDTHTPTIKKAMDDVKAILRTRKNFAARLKDSDFIKRLVETISLSFKAESPSSYFSYIQALRSLKSETARSLLYELFTASSRKEGGADIHTLKVLVKAGIDRNPNIQTSDLFIQEIEYLKEDMELQEKLGYPIMQTT